MSTHPAQYGIKQECAHSAGFKKQRVEDRFVFCGHGHPFRLFVNRFGLSGRLASNIGYSEKIQG
jgi:hypothetical protein